MLSPVTVRYIRNRSAKCEFPNF